MDERLAAADAALKAGRGHEAIPHLIALLDASPDQPVQIYRILLVQLYQAGLYEDGERWGAVAAARHPRDAEIWNVRGVMLRRLKRYPEALKALDQALKLNPKNVSIQVNRGNVLLDLEDGPRAEAAFAKLSRLDPRNGEYLRQLGRALLRQGRADAGMAKLRQAVTVRKDTIEAWLDMIGVEIEAFHPKEAEALADRGLAANPEHPRLFEAKAIVMRRSGQLRRAEAFLMELLPRFGNLPWLHYQLGAVVADSDRDRGNLHLRKAVELDPSNRDHLLALIESLERSRTGDEGAHIEEAYQLLRRAMAEGLGQFTAAHKKTAFEVLIRVSAFDELDRLGDLKSLGRGWAESGRHTALLKLLAHVKSLDDRYELLEQHRIWGRLTDGYAAKMPIRRPEPQPGSAGRRIRIGFMSSDLRQHPVGYFALPLFEHVDSQRFEIFCYSFYQGATADRMQDFFATKSTAYRWNPEINAHDAAQMIADDQLDILFELGGTTHMNKLDVMAYRPAPVQASWLGYPHSAGLSAIDYLLCDPYNTPPRRDLIVEQPLTMPHSWIALGRMVFSEAHVIEKGLPEDRAGRITFGTANNPHKYNREMIALWSKVLMATPGSRFLFVRPEGSGESFRQNLRNEFGKHGVDPERIQFHAVRGAHMPIYNQIDISLDTLPLTGGTTTTEALWMGVPVVSLIGEAFFERLSYSILANSNLADLATEDPAQFIKIAVDLAADRNRRSEIRENLRAWMKSGPLGRTDQFAKDFYDLVARTVRPTT